MKRLPAFFCAAMLCFAGTARATEPCVNPAPESFAATVNAAPLIVHGKILSQNAKAGTTSVAALETLKGASPGKTLDLSGWLHDDPPLFVYPKGAELVLLINTLPNGKFALSDLSWKDCTPSLIDRIPDGRFMVNGTPMTLDTFRQTFLTGATP